MEAEDKESISSRIKVVPAHSVGLSPRGAQSPMSGAALRAARAGAQRALTSDLWVHGAHHDCSPDAVLFLSCAF